MPEQNFTLKLSCIFLLHFCLFFTSASFVLITSLYNEIDEKRVLEYIYCMEKNLEHPRITTVHVVYDTSADKKEPSRILNYLQSRPIAITNCTGRPTFQFFFDLANKTYPHSQIILSNADIYFNETLHTLDGFNFEGKFLALTRWNVLQDGSLKLFYRNGTTENIWSQDTWVFTTPFTYIKKANFGLGTVHCDGKIAYIAKKSGLKLFNPCKSIQCCHLHLAPIWHYKVVKADDKIMAQVAWSRMEDIV